VKSTRFRVVIAAAALLFSSVSQGAELKEVQGPWMVASPQFFGVHNSGTYYYPSVIQQGNYAFLFTQGGQFDASTTPPGVEWCQGDKIMMWRGALSSTGFQGPFSLIRRVSRCDSNSAKRVHWGPEGAFLAGSTGPVYILAERQEIDKQTELQTSSSIWWYTGTFNSVTNPTDLNWTLVKLFETASTVGRVGCCIMAFDTTRTAPADGYSHLLTRGFGIKQQSSFEARFDFSQKYCDNGTSSAPQPGACVVIEFKSGGVWRKVNSGVLDFTPDTFLPQFRARNLVKRGPNLELWGSRVHSATPINCPCSSGSANSAQLAWYTVNATDFSLTGPNDVTESVPAIRCMPAGPAAIRNGVDVVVLQGVTYLFSDQNDDSPCSSTPFQGMDIVTTIVQP
jgi:hypothetical protein